MKKEVVIGIFGVAFILMLLAALFRSKSVQDTSQNALHEIRTFDMWKQSAYTPAAYCPTYPQGGQGYYSPQGGAVQQIAVQSANTLQAQPEMVQQIVVQPANIQQAQPGMVQQAAAQPTATQQVAPGAGAPPIFAGQEKPVLIKQMGVEAVPVTGGKVKITGVMGSSWADKAGLKAGDILLSFDTKKLTSFEQFQSLVTTAAPEKDYKITYLRGTRTEKGLVTIGEGEMEGFTPIK